MIIPKRNIWRKTMQRCMYAKKSIEGLKRKTIRNLLTQKQVGKKEQKNK